MASLQDQLLKAGLVDKKKANQVKKQKHKTQKQVRKHKLEVTDEAKEAAKATKQQQLERTQELNRQKQQELEQRAIAGQIQQLVSMNKLDRLGGDIGFSFADQGKVKKIYVNAKQQDHLSQGRLAIGKLFDKGEVFYELVPLAVAQKIAERDATAVIIIEAQTQQTEEDDPYADFQIPDDLMW